MAKFKWRVVCGGKKHKKTRSKHKTKKAAKAASGHGCSVRKA